LRAGKKISIVWEGLGRGRSTNRSRKSGSQSLKGPVENVRKLGRRWDWDCTRLNKKGGELQNRNRVVSSISEGPAICTPEGKIARGNKGERRGECFGKKNQGEGRAFRALRRWAVKAKRDEEVSGRKQDPKMTMGAYKFKLLKYCTVRGVRRGGW